jgi:tetratricopeptide (TPR) repeat protein
MSGPRRIALALLAGLAAVVAQPAPPAGERIFEVPGHVGDWESEGADWFGLSGYNIRFSVPLGGDRDGFWQLLEAAADRGVALRFRFDAAAGRLEEDGHHVIYPLCAIGAANGSWYGDTAHNCPQSAEARPRAERLLALGLALAFDHPEAARRTLAEALAAPGLPANGQALALRNRGDAAEAMSFDFEPTSAAHDRLWADALADYRRLVVLVPDRAGPRSAMAAALVALGGYDEALAVYQEIRRRWPDQAFQAAVDIGSLYRQRGDYPRALATLDDYARTGDAAQMDGMKFHYHRAWTLVLLGRDEEALREIERGLTTQPDYSAAFLLRSCARARLGRLAEALADERRALELRSEFFGQSSAGVRADLARSRTVIALLEQAVAARRRGPISAPCEGFWDRWIRPRARSPLLVAPAPPAPG